MGAGSGSGVSIDGEERQSLEKMTVSLAVRPVVTGWETARDPGSARVREQAPPEEQLSARQAAEAPQPTPAQLLKCTPALLETSAKHLVQPSARESGGETGSTGQRTSRRHHAALEARSYLEEHNILPF